MSQSMRKINDLKLLRQLVRQSEEWVEEHIYSKLRVGDMWWIPDAISNFGQGERHPWVVVVDYEPNRPPVLACPRTTKVGRRSDELMIPAGVVRGLDKEGAVLLRFRRPFPAEKFREFEYIDRLPEEWIRKVCEGIKKQTGGAI